MQRKQHLMCGLLLLSIVLCLPQSPRAAINRHINARSAILLDMDSGCILFEQNADTHIAPASITKILTLYLVFEAIKEGQVHLRDRVEVSARAAATGGSRMGLKAGTRVSLEELIKGMAVVSGNDACVAAAEHLSGNVDRFVRKMNAKARELGMTSTRFMTPNGLPAAGQVTTARDIAKLSIAYLRRFPESLTIHSMQAYSYGKSSHHNANRLLGKCQGVDGLKTGFVCASGYNISATAKRNGTRVLAVVMGARTPSIRMTETEKLLEAGFRECGAPSNDVKYASTAERSKDVRAAGKSSKRAACKIERKKVSQRLARVNAVTAKKGVKSSKKSVKVVKAVEKPGKNTSARNKKVAAAASKKDKSCKVTVRSENSGKKPAGLKSAKAKQTTAKTQKQVKSSGKKQTKTAVKKPATKTAPHANASKKKAKG